MSELNRILEKHADSISKVTVRTFTDTDNESETYVLIEGDRDALRFLGELILAHSSSETCSLSIHPKAAGKAHFSDDSTVGMYLHRLPCDLHPGNKVR